MSKVLLLDRDGTICRAMPRGRYLTHPKELEILPGVREFLEAAKAKGYQLAVVTNQPQIARGLITEIILKEVHDLMRRSLPHLIDKVYYCPHQDENNCLCRKPKPGMLQQALEELRGDPAQSFMIGDSDRDVLAGQAIPVRTVFIRDEQNDHEFARCRPDFVVKNITEVLPLLTP